MTTAIAVVGLPLSLYLFITQRFATRKAHVEPRAEVYSYTRPGWSPADEHLLILTNHGPARADDVRVRLLDDDGNEDTSLILMGYAFKPFEVPKVWPGQTLHFAVAVPMGAGPPHRVEVSWKDKRSGRQTRDYYVAERRVGL